MNHTTTSPDVMAVRDLHRILTLVHSGESLEDVLREAAQGVVDVLGFRVVAINLLTSHGDFEAVTVLGPAADTILGTRNTRDGFLSELEIADRWGGLLRFVPAERHQARDSAVRWITDEEPVDAPDAWLPEDALFAPLYDANGELVGILSVDLPRDGLRPDDTTLTLLELYANQIGVAVTQARERDRLRERVRLSQATHSIVQNAGAVLELDEVLKTSIAPLVEGFRAERAWIRLFADAAGGWESVNFPPDLLETLTVSAQAPDPRPVDPDDVLRRAGLLAEACWRGQHTAVIARRGYDNSRRMISEVARDRVLDWLAGIGHAQFVMVPLGAAQQCLGYVVLSRTEARGDWTGPEEDAALDMGRELGRVIFSARNQQRERDLVRALENLDAHRSQVITTVVHELKNPLAAILGNLELARDNTGLTERAHEAIATSAQRMLGLVQNMLTLTRLRDSPTPADPTPVDLVALGGEVVALVAAQAEQGHVTVSPVEAPTPVVVHGDPDELGQLLLNLVSNAVKYSCPGDRVRLAVSRVGDEARFVCEDSGLGISVADQEHLFEEFERSTDAEALSRPGTGLGLAIAQRVVQRHGGRIEVDSEPGVGSTFTVHLPVG